MPDRAVQGFVKSTPLPRRLLPNGPPARSGQRHAHWYLRGRGRVPVVKPPCAINAAGFRLPSFVTLPSPFPTTAAARRNGVASSRAHRRTPPWPSQICQCLCRREGTKLIAVGDRCFRRVSALTAAPTRPVSMAAPVKTERLSPSSCVKSRRCVAFMAFWKTVPRLRSTLIWRRA